jgi:hypothetical protein
MNDKAFDGRRYLSKVNGKDYLEVKWRLLWLRTEHPDAAVQTELVKHEAGLALFRAQVTLPEGGEASGWGSETASDFVDYVEKAETKALGRALAALAYGTQFCEDFDFRRDGQGPAVDAPVEPPAKQSSGRRSFRTSADARDARATTPQVKAIYSLARANKSLDEQGMEERCQAAYGCPPADLSKRQASQFIDALKRESRVTATARG